ncbi:hypothetical protein PGUG_03714 [Meyerozyma guilliermondii ATCC 6260]|uniref:Uncharacterized protein n=1 Tax=Meyerozyma guilliermondii (strain ATCC 6260 / CBS 566 / DSM 6381 / JCM 1539 / NBRC 10279 / NRRL Y-324) TaxID=294746 RepID=A5DKB3_PICGU|nr:uncharacterized protein PGUG_03714 [Meyerozyma guilliermondii ATCC 6260]EDK39616.2 hypothetical protein PGUG_03714 [Meyerozyma guilliermondii ATCC 6260]
MLAVLLVGLVFVVLAIALPYMSGLATYEKQKKKKPTKSVHSTSAVSSGTMGYLPPDEIARQEQANETHKDSLKNRVKVTTDDLPVRMTLKHDGTPSLRKRKEKLDVDTDPNHYDYDLDELITEEGNLAAAEQQAQFYRGQTLGKSAKEMV